MFFHVIKYISSYVLILFTAISFASGLFYLAELAEEYTSIALKSIKISIYIIISLHLLLWLIDGISFFVIFIGLLTHALYYNLLSSFPDVNLKSLNSISASILLLLSNYLWYDYFSSNWWTREYMMSDIMPFLFFIIWLVPLELFISLSFDEMVLPNNSMGITDSQKNQVKNIVVKIYLKIV